MFLCYLGARTFLAEPAHDPATARGGALAAVWGSTFVLTLTNPTTILSFVAIFAGLGLGDTGGDYVDATILMIGVFLGSALWWLGLSGVVGGLRERVGRRGLRLVNRTSGLVIGGFGIAALAAVAFDLF